MSFCVEPAGLAELLLAEGQARSEKEVAARACQTSELFDEGHC